MALYTKPLAKSSQKKTKKDKKMKLKLEKITNTKTLKEYATSYKGVHARITSNVSLKEEYTHELYKAEYILGLALLPCQVLKQQKK